ncbi:MAG: hypothetical protein M3323_06555 [Actinomycetota bacterium]|nr:hypothetical protein [Actinomycetota bacterium]
MVDKSLIQRMARLAVILEASDDAVERLARNDAEATLAGLLQALNSGQVSEWGFRRYLVYFTIEELQNAGTPASLIADRQRQDRPVDLQPFTAMEKRDPPPTLSDLLGRPPAESDSLILRGVQRFASEAADLSPDARLELNRRLERWWPSDGFASAITRTGTQSWTITWPASAWLWLGPAADITPSQTQWFEMATSGVVMEEHARWLQAHWHPDIGDLIVEGFGSEKMTEWSRLLACVPDPVPERVVEKLISNVNELSDRYELSAIGKRVVEASGVAALRRLAEKSDEFEAILAPLLAERGDLRSLALLLETLKRTLPEGELPYSMDLEWLKGATDPSLLGKLFDCLRIAYKRQVAERGFSDTTTPILQAISRIGGEDAIAGFDKILEEEPDCQFLRSDRDSILQAELRDEAVSCLPAALDQLGLPLLAEDGAMP